MNRGDSKKWATAYLLDLHGLTIEMGDGYWATMRAWRVEPAAGTPYGLRYALSLHSPGGRRLVGYDNAHLPDELQFKSHAARARQPFDHIHYEGRNVRVYHFRSPGDLMEDFWRSVDMKLKEEGVE